jgi:hypothetical protein
VLRLKMGEISLKGNSKAEGYPSFNYPVEGPDQDSI